MATSRSRLKRFIGWTVFILALLATIVFSFLLYANSVNDKSLDWARYDNISKAAIVVAIVLSVVIAVLFIVLLIRGYDRAGDTFDEREAFFIPENPPAPLPQVDDSTTDLPKGWGQGPEVVIYNLAGMGEMYKPWEKVPKRRKAPFTYSFYFPRSVDSALYINNYIPLDAQGNVLKLRTLIAGPKDAQKKDLPRDKQFPKKAPPPGAAKAPSAWVPGQGPPPQSMQTSTWVPGQGPPPQSLQAAPVTETAPANGAATAAAAPTATAVRADNPYKAKPIVVGSGDGREFLQELEDKIKARDAQKADSFRATSSGPEAFYDYTGDVNDVEDIEGIGKTFAHKLREIGIFTTARLTYEDADKVSQAIGVPKKTVETWRTAAEFMKVSGIGKQYAEALARSGIGGIAELKKRSAETIAEQVNAYLDSLKSNVLGTKITPKRVEGWQKAARDMRRVRLKVPER